MSYYIRSNFFLKSCIFMSFCLISVFGIVNIYSASTAATSVISSFYQKQSIFLCSSVFLIYYVKKYGVYYLYKYSHFFMFLVMILLILLFFIGTGRGSNRWINLGFFSLQPSEFAKLFLIMCLSRYFYDLNGNVRFREWFFAICIIGSVAFAVLIQPDLGTAVIIFICGGSIIIFAGMAARFFVISGMLFILGLPVSWRFLHEYQRQRVITLIFQSDPLGAGYQIAQSKIAIGSGGFFGKGFLQGTQSALNFLPEKRTDFIFALIAEEWGFFACTVLILLYAFIVFGGMYLGLKKKNNFHKFAILSSCVLIFSHVFINIGMVCGILPVVGVPLPLVSYGGSSFLTFAVCIGVILSEEKYLCFKF